MIYATNLGENVYLVHYASTLEKFSDYLQTAQAMVDPFEIISKVG
jgi:hypothetical protein